MMPKNRDSNDIGWFKFIPPEILDGIVQSLPTRQIVKLSCTCRHLYAVCNQDVLWKKKWLSGYFKEATFEVSEWIYCHPC